MVVRCILSGFPAQMKLEIVLSTFLITKVKDLEGQGKRMLIAKVQKCTTNVHINQCQIASRPNANGNFKIDLG